MTQSQALDEIDRLRTNLQAVLEIAAYEIRPCRRCGEMLYFVRCKSTRPDAKFLFVPFTVEGIDHSTTHLRRRAATQEALFDAAPLPD